MSARARGAGLQRMVVTGLRDGGVHRTCGHTAPAQCYREVPPPSATRPGKCQQLLELARERYVSPYHMAYVCTGLGDDDTAIDFLVRAFEERAGAIYGIKGSFLFTSLHPHPRFRTLLARMNLA